VTVIGSKEIRRRILEEKLVENYIDLETQLQPAGFDLTVKNVGKFSKGGKIDFNNSRRSIPDVIHLPLRHYLKRNPYWLIAPGAYMVSLNEKVNMPLDLMGDSIYRSSLMRCGVFTGLGRWDPGYSGTGVSLLIVANPHGFKLYKNARICQIKFERVEDVDSGYNGLYQNEGGNNEPETT